MPRPEPKFTINLAGGSVGLSFTAEAARTLQERINELMGQLRLAAVQATPDKSGVKTKVPPQPSMEYQYTGDVFVEVFCNPNIWPSPYAAKVLMTVRDDRIRLTTEVELTRLIEDIERYLESVF